MAEKRTDALKIVGVAGCFAIVAKVVAPYYFSPAIANYIALVAFAATVAMVILAVIGGRGSFRWQKSV